MRSFKRDGTMLVDGRVIEAEARLTYESQTDYGKTYTTTIWKDGFVSCNCRGWATHKNCWHIRDAASQTATFLLDVQRVAAEARKMEPTALQVEVALDPIQHEGTYYKRKIVL